MFRTCVDMEEPGLAVNQKLVCLDVDVEARTVSRLTVHNTPANVP